MDPREAILVALTGAYLDAGLDHEISTLELQKLAYFMQLSGERLNLRFVAHHSGPCADALRKVLEVMEGRDICGFGDDATRPDVTLELLPGALDRANTVLDERPATRRAIDNVLALIEGFEDPYGLELLATTHWVMKQDRNAAADVDRVVRGVHAWSPRKAEMKPAHVGAAWSRLRQRLYEA